MSKERLEEIRDRVRRQTAYECERELLGELDAVKAELAILKDPSDGRCMEITALREDNKALRAELVHARAIKQNRDSLREKLGIAREALELIDMHKEGFEEDLVECPKIAFEALAKLNEPEGK